MRGRQGRLSHARRAMAIAAASAGLIAIGFLVAGTHTQALAGSGPVLTTLPEPTSVTLAATSASLGDSATLTGTTSSTGTITFTLIATDGTTVVDTASVLVTGDGTYSPPNYVMPITGTVTGTYTWQATYLGGDGSTAQDQGGTAEQVTVGQAGPTLTTQASPGVVVGGTVTDTATLSGGYAPTGMITFTLTAPDGKTAVDTETATVAGNGNYTTPAGYAAMAAGLYQWSASYSGDANNSTAQDQGGTAEQVTVGKHSTSLGTTVDDAGTNGAWNELETTGSSAYDTSTVSGVTGIAPTGTVSYTFWANGTCNGTGAAAGTVIIGMQSSPEGPLLAGAYSFKAAYSGDANYVSSISGCDPFTVGAATSSTSSTVIDASTKAVWSGLETTGSSAYDTSTVSGVTGIAPIGAVSYTFWGNGTCNGTGSGAGALNIGVQSTTEGPLAAGVYSFRAAYSGNANYKSSTSSCEAFMVSVMQPTVTTTAKPTAAISGSTLQDTAMLANTASLLGTGSITFSLYGPGDSNCVTALHTEIITAIKTNGPFSTKAGFLANPAGTYEWRATFSGDANNASVTSGCGSEPVAITAQPTMSTTATPKSAGIGTTLQDSAALTNTSNLLGTGTIAFKLFGAGDTKCSLAPVDTETVAAVGTNGPFNSTRGYVAKTIGTYEWMVSFTGDANNSTVISKCGAEPVIVGAQISETTPGGTSCAQFATGHATSFPAIDYKLSGTMIGSIVAPTTSFVYWVKVNATGTYKVTQSISETSKPLLLLSGSAVFDNYNPALGSCAAVSGGSITQKASTGTVTIKFKSGKGPFYIGLNFSSTSVVGEATPQPSTTVQYIFGAGLVGSTSAVDLKEV